MTTLDRPINTKARRVGKLEKPAPLKRSLSVNAGTEEKLHSAKIKLDNSAEQLCAKDVETVGRESTEDNCKEIAGLSSRRVSQRKNLKLVKPRPLKKRSDETISPTETIEVPFIENINNNNLPELTNSSTNSERCTYLSQMSRDSGVGDMDRSDSRLSQLNSVGEDEVFSPEPVDHNANRYTDTSRHTDKQPGDDLDWDDIDEQSEPFVFGHQQLKHTSFAVNQAIPFSSFLENSEKLPKSVGRGRGRNNSRNQSQKPKAHNPQYMRSQSVPSCLSETQSFRNDNNNNNHEDWEPEVDNSVVDQVSSVTDKFENENNNNINKNLGRLNQTNSESNERFNRANNQSSHSNFSGKSSFSEDWEMELIDTNVYHNVQYSVSVKTYSDEKKEETEMRLPRQTGSVVYNHSIQTAVNQVFNSERQTITETPEPVRTADIETETTPKASSSLVDVIQHIKNCDTQPTMVPPAGFVSTYSPYFPPIQKSNGSVEKQDHSASSTRSNTPVNVNPQDFTITPVKDPWAALDKADSEKSTSVVTYRSKHLDYDTCSSDSKTSDTDTSMTTSDDGYSEQQHAWGLIDDLTDKLQDVSLDTGSSNRSSVAESENNPILAEPNQQDNFVKEVQRDMNIEDSQVVNNTSRVISNLDNVPKKKSGKWPNGMVRLLVTRDPLSPSSMLQEIWQVEQTQPDTGMYSAKGRRKMFRNYAICRELETVTDDTDLIQYSVDELLQMGTSPLSREVPETWSYLVAIYPDICLKDVTKFFDVEKYREERGYVMENYLVKDISRMTNNRQGSLTDSSNRQDKSRPFGFQRSISMPTGNSTQSTFSSMETLSVTENQSGFGTRSHGFGQPGQQQSFRPNGFGNQGDNGTRPRAFGNPPQQEVKKTFGSSDLDTKCDISVRSNGLSRVFSDSGSIVNTGFLKLGEENTDPQSIGSEKSFHRSNSNSCFAGNKLRNYSDLLSAREPSGSPEEEFYMNRDLPEHCPW